LQPLGQPQATVSEEAFNGKTGTSTSGNTTNVTITDYAAIQLTVPASQQQPQGQKGMILPFQPLALTFDNMSYFVDMPAEMKAQGLTSERLQLLRSISGAFRPGVLTALMGVSGAGKTTLMDVLAGRKTGGYIEGTIKVAGYTKVQKTFARISGYVEQTDIHSPQVLVLFLHSLIVFRFSLEGPVYAIAVLLLSVGGSP
jgi:ABC-type glutathione transport system ATPase component